MLDLLIKLILYLSLQYSENEKGQVQMTGSEMSKLKSSQEYIDNRCPSIEGIEIINDSKESNDIVVTPDVDPKAVK